MSEQQEVKVYKFTFKHVNHSTFTGIIKATNIDNRDTQMLSLLSQRYRRNIGLDSRYGKVIFEEIV